MKNHLLPFPLFPSRPVRNASAPPPVFPTRSDDLPEDLLDPPFSCVTPLPSPPSPATEVTSEGVPSAGAPSAPQVDPSYLAAIEETWIEIQGHIRPFSPDDIACIVQWQQMGIPVTLIVSVMRETARKPTGRGGQRPRVYHLRYFRAEILRRLRPAKSQLPSSRSSLPTSGRSSASSRPASPPLPELSSAKVIQLRQELCNMLENWAADLQTAPYFWVRRGEHLPRTTACCVQAGDTLRTWITRINEGASVRMDTIEEQLMEMEESIWTALRGELAPERLPKLTLPANPSPTLRLEAQQRQRRQCLREYHLPVPMTVLNWWEEQVFPAGGGLSLQVYRQESKDQ